jgi:hypothetical protein
MLNITCMLVNLVWFDWLLKKQPTVSRSSTESKYRALAIASAELCWIRTFSKTLASFSPKHQSFGVITFLHLPLPPTLCFMLAQNTLRLISILSERECFARILKLNLFPLLINLLTSSTRVYPHNGLLISNAISRSLSL